MIKRLRNKDGQIIPVLAVFMLTLVLVFVIVYNLGKVTYTRMQTQNATDVAAISTSAWQARGLNLISTLNLTITASYVGTIVAAAFGVPFTEFPPFYIRLQLKMQSFIKNAFNKYHLGTGTAAVIGKMNGADFTFPYPIPPKLYVKQMELSSDQEVLNNTGDQSKGGRDKSDERWWEHRSGRESPGDTVSECNIIHLKNPDIDVSAVIAHGRVKADTFGGPPAHNQCWSINPLRNRIRNLLLSKIPNAAYVDAIMHAIRTTEFCMTPSDVNKEMVIDTLQHSKIFEASASEGAIDLPVPGKLEVFVDAKAILKGQRRRQDYGHTKHCYYTATCSTLVADGDSSYWETYPCTLDSCNYWVWDSTVYYYNLSIEYFVGLDVKAAIEFVMGMMRDKDLLDKELPGASAEEVYVTSVKLPKHSTFGQVIPPYITIAKSKVFNSNPSESTASNLGLWKPTWRAVLMPVGQKSVDSLLSNYNIVTTVNEAIKKVDEMEYEFGIHSAEYDTIKSKWDQLKQAKIIYH